MKQPTVGATFTAGDVAALTALLVFARRQGHAQTPAIVKLAQKAQRLAAIIENRGDDA